MAPLVQNPHQEEQCPGREAVVDHLEHPTLDTLDCEGEKPQHDKAEVAYRAVGDKFLDVRLDPGH